MAYRPVDVVEVRIWGKRVGAVALDPTSGFYVLEYTPAWQRDGIELAPTTMPVRVRTHVFPTLPPATYQRLPAMLADALPDDFGNALTDAYLAAQGVEREQITPLDRLAYLADRGVGAVEFRPTRGPRTTRSTAIDLAHLVTGARALLSEDFSHDGAATDALQHLIAVGTSAGGARAKAVIAWNRETGEVRSGQLDTDAGFEHWLVKLDGVQPDHDLGTSGSYGRIEFAYSQMATAAGIEMTECHLLEEGGRAHFMTRRFDRDDDGGKVHVQTLCALSHLDFRQIGAHDYAQLFELIDRLQLGPASRAEAFRRMVFNVAAANFDDHTKNISFLLPLASSWRLSPAYDMTHAYSPTSRWTSQHLMAVNSARTNISRDDVLQVADRFAVPAPRAILEQVLTAVGGWGELAAAAGIGKSDRERVQTDIAQTSGPLRP